MSPHARFARTVLPAFAIGLAATSAARAADGYSFSITSQASSVAYDASTTAPFTGTMTGDTSATPPTRLKHGSGFIIVNCGTFGATTNENIIISGSITANGTSSNIRPTGTFQLSVDQGAGVARVQNLTLNLLGSSTATIAASLGNFRYETFCAVNPSCSLPFLTPITLPLGNISITALVATQLPGIADGTLTPMGAAGVYTVNIPLIVEVAAAASLTGTPLPLVPQQVPIVLNGTLVISGNTATFSNDLDVSLEPPGNTTPQAFPPLAVPLPADSPICPGLNLLIAMTISSTTISVGTEATLVSAGTRLPCPCDWNNSGDISVQDVFDFLTGFFSNAGDFNGDGMTTVQDIFDFLTCFFGRPIGC